MLRPAPLMQANACMDAHIATASHVAAGHRAARTHNKGRFCSAQYYARHAAMVAQTENLPYAEQTIDLDPTVRG
jgi:hypothetical protein